MSSVISFEDVNVHELASTVTTLPPEEAPHVLQALVALTPADGTHDAVDAWLHAAEAALQGEPGQTDISRGRLLLHEASRSHMVEDEPQQPPAPAPESRIWTPSALLFVAVSTITMVLLLLFFGMARSKCTGAGLCSAPHMPAAAACHPDGPWSTFVQVQWALSNLTHIAASLGAVANALAPSIMHVHNLGATDIIYAGAEATALTMWDGRAVALLCSALVAAAAVHHILTTLIARIAFSTGAKPRRQLATPTQRKRAPASKRETLPQTPPRGSTAWGKAEVQHAGTQTPPPKTVVLPEARGSRRSARIMVKQMAQAQQQLV